MNQNSKGFINILVGVIIVAIIAVVGYFAFNKKSEVPNINPDNQNQATSTNPQTDNNQNQTENPKPGFKVYEDNNFHFLFQYPSQLSLKSEKTPYQRVILSDPTDTSNTLTLYIESKKALEDFLNQFSKDNIKDVSTENFKATAVNLDPFVSVGVEKKNYNYVVTTGYAKNSKSESLFNQVFPTIRFIESATHEIRVIYPAVGPVGEWWQTGKTYKIKWQGGAQKVDLFLVSFKGGFSKPLATSTVWSARSITNQGFYDITVPEKMAGLGVAVQIKDSEGNFGESNMIEILNYDLNEKAKEWGNIIPVKKPAIYLYPKTESVVSVNLVINGEITKSIPNYNTGWKVFVEKNGKINKQFDYLFYEANLKNLVLPDNGWVVDFKDLDSWFDINLSNLGLNRKEISDFKDYWLKILPESNYYEIKLLTENFLNENMTLNINPKPNSLIRLDFYFKPLKEKINIITPIIKTPARSGFTVVEWGGILDNQ